MPDTKELEREMEFLRGSIIENLETIVTDVWPQNMQAISDLANEMRYQCEFGETVKSKVVVTLTPRPRRERPTVQPKTPLVPAA